MILTKKQEEGLNIAIARYQLGMPYTCISGYAGTGKSTLVNVIVEALDLDPITEVAYITFTGKAANVLRHKNCPNAMTAHKLLYKARPTPSGKFIYSPKDVLEGNYKLIVVDEISMLPIDLWRLLLSHGIYVIACGDPFQIPPIDPQTDNHVLDKPHVFLDEIMRQAQESEIIRISMDIRNFKPLNYFKGTEVQIIKSSEMVDGMLTWADQIIVGTNAKRQEINDVMRKKAGRGPEPEVGDKIIALRNCWETFDMNYEMALVNGTIGELTSVEKELKNYQLYGIPTVPVLNIGFKTSDDDIFGEVICDYQALKNGKKFLSPQQEYKIFRSKYKGQEPIEFNYGYAITGHRAQGSQWDKVLVIEERFPFDKLEHARWLYTSCTRAAEKLVLVR